MNAHHEGWNFSPVTAVLDTWSARMLIALRTGGLVPPVTLAARVLYAKIFWCFQTVPWVHFSGSKLQAAHLLFSYGLFQEVKRILFNNGPNSTLPFVCCRLPLYCSAGKKTKCHSWHKKENTSNKSWRAWVDSKICKIQCWKPLFKCTTKATATEQRRVWNEKEGVSVRIILPYGNHCFTFCIAVLLLCFYLMFFFFLIIPLCTHILYPTKAFSVVNASQTHKRLPEQYYMPCFRRWFLFKCFTITHGLLCFYMFCQYGSHALNEELENATLQKKPSILLEVVGIDACWLSWHDFPWADSPVDQAGPLISSTV